MSAPAISAARNRAIIIPALNEEASIGPALEALPRGLFNQIIVVDNASTDRTAERARHAGAKVIWEPRRGYGQACLSGIAGLDPDTSTVVFMDGDLSDNPQDAQRLVEGVEAGGYDVVIGSRVLGHRELGALQPWQRFGNWIATRLLRLLWRVEYTDLGPFRALKMSGLSKLEMRDRNFGWTVEMQAQAARLRLRVSEVPVDYRVRRYGTSKISGNLLASARAGMKILWTIVICSLRSSRTGAGRG